MEKTTTGLFDMSQERKEAIGRFQERLRVQGELIREQKREIFGAILAQKDEVWITKESGGRVKFTIQQAIQGLTTMNLNYNTYKELYDELLMFGTSGVVTAVESITVSNLSPSSSSISNLTEQ